MSGVIMHDNSSYTNSDGETDGEYLHEVYLIEDDDQSNTGSLSNESTEVTCNLCSQCVKLDSLQKHMEALHFDYKCPNCERKYYNESQLQKHLRCAHLQSMHLKCPFCPVILKNKYNYKQHLFIHSSEAIFKCNYENCGKSFKHINTLKQHEKIHENRNRRECPYCHERVTRLEMHIKTHTGDRPFVCEICDRTYMTKQQLKVHLGTHSEEGFLCEICNFTFKSVNSLTKHQKSIHTNVKYSCPGCDMIFNRKDNMKTHMKKAHREFIEELITKKKS